MAILPGAAQYWRYKSLRAEQADSLTFAAQAYRLLEQLDDAERLLERAGTVLQEISGETVDDRQEEKELRDLRISLNIQYAWLREAQALKQEYHSRIRELWRSIRPEDKDSVVLLGTLIRIEKDVTLLRSDWPLTQGAARYTDPDNDSLSLPSEWFEGENPVRLINLYEFRLYQLLYLQVQKIFNFSLGGLGHLNQWLRPLFGMAGPNVLFDSGQLQYNAQLGWRRISKFGEIENRFASFGLECVPSERTETRALIIELLKAVRFYFGKVDPVDREELESLRLLMHYNLDSETYRLDYVKVLCEHQYLMERELRELTSRGSTDWYAVASHMERYLGVLQDAELTTELLGNELIAKSPWSGLSEQEVWQGFAEEQRQRKEGLKRAQEQYTSGDKAGCLRVLDSVLPAQRSAWVSMDDLRTLNLWLRCATDSNKYDVGKISQRKAQLRDLAVRYVEQFTRTVKEPPVRNLARWAVRILGAIEKSVSA